MICRAEHSNDNVKTPQHTRFFEEAKKMTYSLPIVVGLIIWNILRFVEKIFAMWENAKHLSNA